MSVRVATFLLLLALPAAAQEAERRKMLEKVGPSVVALRNNEGHGSGIILDDQGTILTNAHVIVSPLPFRVEAEVREDGRLRTVYFQKVVLIGVHPDRDLALVRIDPSEHKVKLAPIPISKSKVVTKDLVHAIGFPGRYGGAQKMCMSGEVTGVDQYVDMPGYFECSTEISGGNSGGPIVDSFGHAVGVVTFGKMSGTPAGWAIPLHDFRPDQFVPLDRRAPNPAKASKILQYAEELLKEARGGPRFFGHLSSDLFQMALLEDFSNADIYFKIGMIKRNYGNHSTAAAYLVRSLQIHPWMDARQEAYHELGAALYKLRRPKDAVVVWEEGIAKYPGDSGMIWDALAIYHFEDARFLEAACASRASLRAFGPRADAMNTLYDKCRKRLDPSGLTALAEYERSLDNQSQALRKDAEKAKQDGKRSMTPAFDSLMRSYDGVQKEAANFNFSSLGQGPNAPKPLNIPDAELIPLFIRSRIAVAAEHLSAGRLEKATEVLEDILKTHPDHPECGTAKDLLGIIKKKK